MSARASRAVEIDRRDSRPRLLRSAFERAQRRSRLDDDDAHVVGDHVVKLPRDPLAFGGHGPRVALLALAFEPGRPFLDLADVGLAFARPDAQRPHHKEGELALDHAGDAGRQHVLLDHHDQEHERRSRRQQARSRAIHLLAHRVQGDERPEGCAECVLDDEDLHHQSPERDEEDRDWPAAPDREGDGLEQQQGEVERVDLAEVLGAGRQREDRQGAQSQRQQRVHHKGLRGRLRAQRLERQASARGLAHPHRVGAGREPGHRSAVASRLVLKDEVRSRGERLALRKRPA